MSSLCPIFSLKVLEHNVGVKELLETKGQGRVLFIDGGGSMRIALVGEYLCSLAQKSGWARIVVNGCIRDVDEINDGCDIGVRAMALHAENRARRALLKSMYLFMLVEVWNCDS
ncbi:hypothetical protein BUALT_Bualt01G0174200 [Buddleja alternifolia]|uniref:4-hydroxy-4-methyl-2-oxoglutarate aldolase n=1 Tax=Buddleja alternifolia TaxID=168488 RepID=A0AAV6YEE6_9LAMI|nr:hypothetical protein BUALT_Bualt01G0174200 [Buddleja alternifolia]